MQPHSERRHVMFVDDEPATHRLVERRLRDAGFRTTCVDDGAQALRVLEQERVDLLITALGMPVVDGVELLRHVANRGLALPVIVLVPADGPEPPPPAIGSPLRFLREPVRPEALVVAAHEHLNSSPPCGAFALPELTLVLATARRSCTLRVLHGAAQGVFLFIAGVLVDASLAGLRGDAAAVELLAAPHAPLRLDLPMRVREATVTRPLPQLLREASDRPAAAPLASPRAPSSSPATSERDPSGPRSVIPTEAPKPALPTPSVLAAMRPLASAAAETSSPEPAPPEPAAPPELAILTAAPPEPATPPEPTTSPEPATLPEPATSPEPATPPELAAWEQPTAQAPIAALLDDALQIEGAIGVALSVWEIDHNLGTRCVEGSLDPRAMHAAVSGNSRVMRAMMSTMQRVGLKSALRDALITVDGQLHVLAPLPRHAGLFLYLVLDDQRANLALARLQIRRLIDRFELVGDS